MTNHCDARVLALATVVLALASPVAAETTQCTIITAVPYTISTPGTYCLTADLSTSISSGNAISINASSVTLDLNGHKLQGGAGAGTMAIGVHALNRRYVVVKNGTIRGFLKAVSFAGNTAGNFANVIEDITAERNWREALYVNACKGCVVRRNLVVNTGGTTINPSDHGAAIVSLGSGNTIRNNEITSVVGTGGGSGFGIMNYANDTLIESNRISSVTVGVYVQIATNVLVSDNRLMNMSDGIFFTIDATGKYRNNLTAGVTTLASRGTDAGGND